MKESLPNNSMLECANYKGNWTLLQRDRNLFNKEKHLECLKDKVLELKDLEIEQDKEVVINALSDISLFKTKAKEELAKIESIILNYEYFLDLV